ncbi:MAG: hypothetical protein ABI193_00070, partial [Minicystis sp.]
MLGIAPRFIDPNALHPGNGRTIQPIDIDLPDLKGQITLPSVTDPVAPPQPAPDQEQPDTRVARSTGVSTGSRDPGAVVDPGAGTPNPDNTGAPAAPPGPAGPAPDQYEPLTADNGTGTFGKVGTRLGLPIYTGPGVLADLPRAAPAPTEAPKPRAIDPNIAGVIVAQAMTENDKKKGLDLLAGGNVQSAAMAAVQVARDAPGTAKVTFVVRLGPNGKVQSVQTGSFNAGSSGVWDQVARAIQAALASQSFTMPGAYNNGAIVYVDVNSTMALPSGATSAVS